MSSEMVKVDTANKISQVTGFTPEQIAIVKHTVAKNTTDTELAYFLSIARDSGLNPFMKEIWCYKDNQENLITFAGRDGRLRNAQESPKWNGMTSGAVYSNDVFEVDLGIGAIKHIPNFKDRGKLLGSYAMIRPKGCELATIVWSDIDDYKKSFGAWKTHTEAMIIKVSEAHVLKKTFPISGTQVEYDYEVSGNIAIPVSDHEVVPFIDESQVEMLESDIVATGADKDKFLAFFKISDITELTTDQYNSAVRMLNDRKSNENS